LTSQIRDCGAKWVDLEEVVLLDLESVEFLIACEAGGEIELRQCSAYIREWMTREAKFGKEQITPNQTRPSIGKEVSIMKTSMQGKPSIVFAHGIWADGSCFQKLIPTLRAEGHDVMAAQYGLDTLRGDVEATVRTFGRVSGPIVLVGHSYGGTVITHAGVDSRVAALVYIAALGPDETETSQGQQDKFPKTDVFEYVEVADGRVWMRPDGVACFAGDLSPEEQGVVYATHFAPALDLFSQKLDGIAWRSKPTWSIVATEDRTVHPELERSAAKRMGATTVEVKSSHVPMLSHPKQVLDVIRNAAVAVQSSMATQRV
jgi:pimeloyl-ACP methyl ester carboxylesterase